jgi:hypothetical protein
MIDKKSIVAGIRKMNLDKKRKQGEATVENLGMLDTYPMLGDSESDTQAQDEGYGEDISSNEIGNEDQEEARKKSNRLKDIFSKLQQRHTGR